MRKMKRKSIQIIAASLLAVVCAGLLTTKSLTAQDAKNQTLQIEGSTTVGPIADGFADYFRKHRNAKISIKKTGSGDGAAALIDGRCQIANMSRFMKGKEFKKAVKNGIYPVAHVIAMDGVCMIVNPKNSVGALTIEQVRKIYKGEIINWNQVGGPDMKIVFISRDTASGTYETFNKLVMKKQKMSSDVEYGNSNPQVYNRVRTTAGAIGYVGLGFVDKKVRALKINGVMPTKKSIASGKYPISRPLYMFTNGYPKLGSLTHQFISFYLTDKGQEIIEAKGFVPVTDY